MLEHQVLYFAKELDKSLKHSIPFHFDLIMLEGFARSLIELMGSEFDASDYPHMARRVKNLQVKIPRWEHLGSIPFILWPDSTELKIYGEGEWKVTSKMPVSVASVSKVYLGADAKASL
ncbi:MAG: transposase [Methylovulum sp.]|nr:transposase [Methylovulum sp.]